jgi:hypothetical protein
MLTRDEKEARRQELRKTRLATSLKENLKRRREPAKADLSKKDGASRVSTLKSNIKSVSSLSLNKD